jgi:hypothetical protein
VLMKIGRNDPCPCGSGKKYKKCCLDKAPALATQQNQEEEGLGGLNAGEPDSWADLPESADVAPDCEEIQDDPERLEKEGESIAGESSSRASEAAAGHPGAPTGGLREIRPLHPRPQFILPELAPEEQAIVDGWWKATRPVLSRRHAGLGTPTGDRPLRGLFGLSSSVNPANPGSSQGNLPCALPQAGQSNRGGGFLPASLS